jgi:membrane fusion protein
MFRKEVSKYKNSDTGSQFVSRTLVAIPISWTTLAIFMFTVVLATFLFLSFSTYSTVSTVPGNIVPENGIASITPIREGVVTALEVNEGAQVSAGDLLVQIRTDLDGVQAASAAEIVGQSLARENASLIAQINAAEGAASAKQNQMSSARAGLVAEIGEIETQLSYQHKLIQSAQLDLARVQEVAARGFVSKRDVLNREEVLVSRQQNAAQLNQALAAKRAALAEAGRAAKEEAAQARAQRANLEGVKEQVEQRAAESLASRSYAIRAPVPGQVTAVIARVGQQANPQSPLMVVVPVGSRMQAELRVPPSAIGFIKPGQRVRVAIDAFPYQQFGSLSGTVKSVAKSATVPQVASEEKAAFYAVIVSLDATVVRAFERNEPLVSGMTLNARIITNKRTLLEWLFEPLYAVKRR